ncbi:hypothetical protein [Mucilaginibacter sp.]|uniref:hypothetical protein n=1 Tax=Mucilaginibacter sp. TaxID=1882438 RepID=UPI00262DBCC6|nr:hypothetical protein [Mucilaginibacter sp.]MDB4919355.1 DoxX family protein [Mucilaginibacter sp.]
MKNISGIAQLILRLALGIGFLMPVMDRIGLIGPYGSHGVSWGDWKHFVSYTHTLVPFASGSITNIMALLATIGEGVFAVCLIVGFKIKEAAFGAGILTMVFGLFMAIFLNIRAPFDYPVFVFTGGALLLSGIDNYKWSVDNYIQNRS